jgi:hypothetical protein
MPRQPVILSLGAAMKNKVTRCAKFTAEMDVVVRCARLQPLL